MTRFKDLEACISLFRGLLAQHDLEPWQKEAVERAIESLRLLRRNARLDKSKIFRCVRDVCELLAEAFLR